MNLAEELRQKVQIAKKEEEILLRKQLPEMYTTLIKIMHEQASRGIEYISSGVTKEISLNYVSLFYKFSNEITAYFEKMECKIDICYTGIEISWYKIK